MKQQGWAGWKKLFAAWVGATADGSLPALPTAARCGGDRAAHFCGKVWMKLTATRLPFAGPHAHVARAAASAGASHQSHREEEPHAARGTDEAAKMEPKGRQQSPERGERQRATAPKLQKDCLIHEGCIFRSHVLPVHADLVQVRTS